MERRPFTSSFSTGNRQAVVGLHVPDLVDGAAGHVVDPPGARRMAVELKSRHVVVGAHAPGDRQALPRLYERDPTRPPQRVIVRRRMDRVDPAGADSRPERQTLGGSLRHVPQCD
jgi:hypothetical protein